MTVKCELNDLHIEFSLFIQDFYSIGTMRCPPSVSIQDLREACDYFLIPFDQSTIQCQDLCMRKKKNNELFFILISYLGGLLHELSNEGAKKQFEMFLENDIFPVLVESAQVRNHRSCFLINNFCWFLAW